jgi:hypothetical protein
METSLKGVENCRCEALEECGEKIFGERVDVKAGVFLKSVKLRWSHPPLRSLEQQARQVVESDE